MVGRGGRGDAVLSEGGDLLDQLGPCPRGSGPIAAHAVTMLPETSASLSSVLLLITTAFCLFFGERDCN